MKKIIVGIFLFIMWFFHIYNQTFAHQEKDHIILYPGQSYFQDIYNKSEKIIIWKNVNHSWSTSEVIILRGIKNAEIWDILYLENLPLDIKEKKDQYTLFYLDKNLWLIENAQYKYKNIKDVKEIEKVNQEMIYEVKNYHHSIITKIIFPIVLIFSILSLAAFHNKKEYYLEGIILSLAISIVYFPYWFQFHHYNWLILGSVILTLIIMVKWRLIEKVKYKMIHIYSILLYYSIYIWIIYIALIKGACTSINIDFFVHYPYIIVLFAIAGNMILYLYYQIHAKEKKKKITL